jgi:hypothetical protein
LALNQSAHRALLRRHAGTETSKVKALLGGACVALVAGLLMGAVAKPDLGYDGRPAGPQMLAAWGGARSSGPFDDGEAFANYKGQIPDYVLGTDWKRALNPPVEMAEPSPLPREPKVAAIDTAPDLPVTHAAYDDPPPEAPSYPSLQGGQSNDADLLPPAHAEPGEGG